MIDVKKLTKDELLHSLVTETARYTQMISCGDMNSEAYHDCKKMLKEIQEEIDRRNEP